MQLITVGAAALNQTPLDWEGNRANILEALARAREQEVTILCLPEMCICGYGCEDAFHGSGMQRMALRVLQELAPETRGLIVSLGLPVFYQNSLFSTACLLADGRILGFVGKQYLANEGLHYEPRWFAPWPAGLRGEVAVGGTKYPIGDIHFACGPVKVGFEICEDAWAARRPGGQLSLKGVDVILNPSASHFAFGKYEVRKRLVLEGSRAFGVTYVYTTLLGNEAGRAIYDGSTLLAAGGEMLAVGPRFGYAQVTLTKAVIDLDRTRMARARTGAFRPEPGQQGECVSVDFEFPRVAAQYATVNEAAWEKGDDVKEEEFTRATCLALFDYLRKSGAGGFTVSLSGGADSSAVACLVALAVRFALQQLGPAQFAERLHDLPVVQGREEESEYVGALLTCVYQSTANSSEATRNAARAVAGAIGARYLELDVEPIVRQYVELATQALGRPLSWETDDLALQNIQARARAPGVWMLANLSGALLLATSNRSEAAVGYATMDGDTSGGLSPIAGIDKAFLRQWLKWLERSGPDGLGPLPVLATVNRLTPTAELRPPEAEQTDEDDLMPYELLDAIERAAIRDKKTPLETFELMRCRFTAFDEASLREWVERFYRLWCRNQWKRERYAPSFHVDDENLDPKTWCRFPILSGGFERELRELSEGALEPAPGP